MNAVWIKSTSRDGLTLMQRNSHPVVSAECPHLQLHDPEVIGFREATVVESVTGSAAAQIQSLIHPQTKMTTGEKTDKRRKK